MPTAKKSTQNKPQRTDEHALPILMKEYDALLDMYVQAERNGQSMFNFYLTLMTATFGGVALVFQPSSGIIMQKTVSSLLLLFFSIIGTMYFATLASNAAHITRYARGINEIRRLLFDRYRVELPPFYSKFMQEKRAETSPWTIRFLSLFVPVSALALFTAVVNSISLAAAISIIYFGVGEGARIPLFGLFTFFSIYLIYSIYARLMFELTISRLNIAIGH